MEKLNAALLGLDNPHSRKHLGTLQTLPEVEKIYLWDEDSDLLAEISESQPDKIAVASTDLNHILANNDIFFATVSRRNDQTPGIALQALGAGVNVIAEKPIGRTVAEVESVVNAADRAGLKLGVFYQNRYNPVVQQMRSIVKQSLLGPLMSVEMRYLTTAVRFRNPKYWVFDQTRAGGGMLTWLGCHYVDMMRYICDDEIVSVSAEVATRSGENIDVEDVAVLNVRLRSGAVGTFHFGYVLAMSGGGYHNKQGNDTYTSVNGRSGRMHWRSNGAPTSLYVETVHDDWREAPAREFNYELRDTPAYGGTIGEEFLRDFIRSAQGKGDPPASGTDALQMARIVEAAYTSSREGRRVEIQLPK